MTNTVSTLSGYFKEVYADNVENLIPDSVSLYKDVKFVEKSKQNGNQYHQPVVLTNEHGITYAAASAGAFAINTPVAAVHKDATVTGSQLLIETRIDYEAAARGNGSPKAFGQATKHIMKNMIDSFQKRIEASMLYGGNSSIYSGICRIGSRITDSGTTQVYAVEDGYWVPGLMAGLENAVVDAYNDDGTGEVASTKLNSSGDITITKVDFANKRLTLTGVESELDALASPANTAAYLYFKGSFGAEMTGAVAIAANEGPLFGIDGAIYGLWQGNSVAVGGLPLTFSTLVAGFDSAVGRGLAEDVTVYLNPNTWTDLMTDEAAFRRYAGAGSFSNGASSISFKAQFGTLTLKPHLMVRESIALAFPTRRCKRLGASDITFRVPGAGDEMLYQLPSNAGYGVRAYANQAFFCERPASMTLFTGITNS